MQLKNLRTVGDVNDFCAKPGVEVVDIHIPNGGPGFFVKYRHLAAVDGKALEGWMADSARLERAVKAAAGDGQRQIAAEAAAHEHDVLLYEGIATTMRHCLRAGGFPMDVADALVADWRKGENEALHVCIDRRGP
jgi:hypothetical protein